MNKKSSLELSILGLLSRGPLHGYELRKMISQNLGLVRAVSFGSVYPELRRLATHRYIQEKTVDSERRITKRARISYEITDEGKKRLSDLLKASGPETWEDDTFTTYLAFFAKTASTVRLQILNGRRIRLQEKINLLQSQLKKADQQLDKYNLQIKYYKIDSVKREINWIDELISGERKES